MLKIVTIQMEVTDKGCKNGLLWQAHGVPCMRSAG